MAAPKKRPRVKLGSPRVGGSKRKQSAARVTQGSDLPEPSSLTEAKRVTETLRAQLLDIDVKVRSGDLVEKAVVERERFREGRLVRDRIRAIPARVAADLYAADSVADVQRTLSQAIDGALEDLSNELR